MTKTNSDQEASGGKRKSSEDFEDEHDSETSDEEDFEKPKPTNKKRKGRKPKECSTTLQAKWDEMFNRLVDFRKRMGHCLVPNRYSEDPQLGSWVSTQRRQYKILTSGGSESTPMTPERASRLMSIGFEWATKDPRHVPWETRYAELIRFVEKYGHAQVPIGWEENVQLSNWVSTQRQEYKLLRKGRSSRLTKDRIKLLDNIGFVWEAQRGGPRRRKSSNSTASSDSASGARISQGSTSMAKDAAAAAASFAVSQAAHQADMRAQSFLAPGRTSSLAQAAAFEDLMASQQARSFAAAGAPISAMELRAISAGRNAQQLRHQLNAHRLMEAQAQHQAHIRLLASGGMQPAFFPGSMNALSPYSPVGMGGLGRLPPNFDMASRLQYAVPSNAMSADIGYDIGVSGALGAVQPGMSGLMGPEAGLMPQNRPVEPTGVSKLAEKEQPAKRRKSAKILEDEEDDNEARQIAVAAFKESLKNFPEGLPARSPHHQQGNLGLL